MDGRPEGAISANGRIMGSYLHGLFAQDAFRAAFIASLGARPSGLSYDAVVEAALDALADHMEAHADVAGLLALAQ
jgi:adenosylcobyric acid synthase